MGLVYPPRRRANHRGRELSISGESDTEVTYELSLESAGALTFAAAYAFEKLRRDGYM